MKKLAIVSAIFLLVPSVSFAAALTQQQSTSLIAVVQSSPGTPASTFVPLETAFSNITVTQATSLITVVQAAPSIPASAFVDLLTSFTVDTATTQPPTITAPQTPIGSSASTTLKITTENQLITFDSFQISWITNIPATSRITIFKGSIDSGAVVTQFVISVDGPTTNGTATVSNLIASTTYAYIIDASTDTAHSSISGLFFTPISQQMLDAMQQAQQKAKEQADYEKWKATYVCPHYDSHWTCYDPRFPDCYIEMGGLSGCGG